MADCVDVDSNTSDEHVDPHCEPCFDSKNRSIQVHGYCHECYQFMCTDCHIHHGKFPALRNLVIFQGSEMPKSIADKPPKYDRCDDHPKQWKDEFCSDHKELVCSVCSSNEHSACSVNSVDDICKTISSTFIDELYDANKNMNDVANCLINAVEANLDDIEQHRHNILQKIQKVNTKLNIMLQDIQLKVAVEFRIQNERLNEDKKKMNCVLDRSQTSLEILNKLKGKNIDTKLFLKMQEYIRYSKHTEDELHVLNRSRRHVLLTMNPSYLLNNIMSDSAMLGSIVTEEIKPCEIDLSDNAHPQLKHQISAYDGVTKPKTNHRQTGSINSPSLLATGVVEVNHFTVASEDLTNGKANSVSETDHGAKTPIDIASQRSYSIKIRADDTYCFITGLALTKCNNRLLVDSSNRKVKLFSPIMKCLSCVSLPETPRDITINNDEAFVTTDNKKLFILNISGGLLSELFVMSQVSIQRMIPLPTAACGIANFKDKVVVRCPFTKPPSVKLVNLNGWVYWTVSKDQQGRQLFKKPWYICCYDDGITPTVVVTDIEKNSLTLLLAKNGTLITTRVLEGNKEPYGITNDMEGNIFVCYYGTDEVAVFTRELKQERILLSRRNGLIGRPKTIMYDKFKKQLIVSYELSSRVESFQLKYN